MEWTPNLSVGDPEIDNQHQELFQLVSMLDHAITTHSPEELGDIIKFLEHYVETHFKEEEDLMIAHNYEEYDLHKFLIVLINLIDLNNDQVTNPNF